MNCQHVCLDNGVVNVLIKGGGFISNTWRRRCHFKLLHVSSCAVNVKFPVAFSEFVYLYLLGM